MEVLRNPLQGTTRTLAPIKMKISKPVCNKDMKVLICIHEYSKKDFTSSTLEQWTTHDPPVNVRFVKDAAKNPGICYNWHLGERNPYWIFTDEI